MGKRIFLLVLASLLALALQAKTKVLIIDGQDWHNAWPKTTVMMKQYLEESGLFVVDVERYQFTWNGDKFADYLELAGARESVNMEDPTDDPNFSPNFKKYDVVVSNLGWKAKEWNEKTKNKFEKFVKKGGGFVAVHAANNAFPDWKEFNKMTGLGGWGGRNETHGPYVYYTNEGELIRDDSPGGGGTHGSKHNFPVTIRISDHPITQGMPEMWLTTNDECYAKLRGPAENMTILATGKDISEKAPTDRHEPVMMIIEYGKGKVFHLTLGHDDVSRENVGFIVSFLRGTQWVASGEVTIPIPEDFPNEKEARNREFILKNASE